MSTYHIFGVANPLKFQKWYFMHRTGISTSFHKPNEIIVFSLRLLITLCKRKYRKWLKEPQNTQDIQYFVINQIQYSLHQRKKKEKKLKKLRSCLNTLTCFLLLKIESNNNFYTKSVDILFNTSNFLNNF